MVFRAPFFALLAGGIVFAIMGAFDERIFAFIWPYNAFVVIAGVLTYLLTPSGAHISITRKFDPVLSVRVPNLVKLYITNEGNHSLKFRLREEPPDEFEVSEREFDVSIEPGERKEIRYHVTPRDRGDYFFRDSFIRVRSVLGMVFRQSRIPTREIVRVYPNILALRKFDLLKQRGHLRQIGIRRSRLKGVGTDFESLRDYVQDDDYRKIEWKASARKAKLVVKEFEAERNQPVILVVDYGRRMMADVEKTEKLDHVLDSSLMLCNAAANANDQVGLLLFADHVDRWIAPRRGRSQVGQIIEALHALRAQPIEPDAITAFSYLASRWKRRGLIVIFTEIETPAEAKEMLTVLGPLAKRHLCLVVTVSDPQVRTAYSRTDTSKDSIFERAAAVLYQEERLTALHLLNRAGVRTLDAEPEELGSALVNYYLTVKATAQL
ncbi:MAG: DUF58 domain-containing protein [Fimbriimonadales bacterium]